MECPEEDRRRADELARRIAGDDPTLAKQAFNELFLWQARDLRRHVGRAVWLCGRRDIDPRDVVQEVFSDVWKKRTEFAKPDTLYRLRAWARNKLVDYTRRFDPPVELMDAENDVPGAPLVDNPIDVEAETQESYCRLRECIQRVLSPEARVAVWLWADHYSYQESAAHQRIPEGTAKTRVFKALAKLRANCGVKLK